MRDRVTLLENRRSYTIGIRRIRVSDNSVINFAAISLLQERENQSVFNRSTRKILLQLLEYIFFFKLIILH